MMIDKIKALLKITDHSQQDLADEWHMSKQALSNKLRRNYLNSDDLIKVAKFCGAELAFLFPNGTRVVLDEGDLKVDKKRPGPKVESRESR